MDPTQDTWRMGTASVKQEEEADTRIIVKEEEADTKIIVIESYEIWKEGTWAL